MNRGLVLVIIIGIFYLSTSLSGGYVGTSMNCVNSKCLVIGSSSLGSVILGIGLIMFVYLGPTPETIDIRNEIVGVWRRFGAFMLDFVVVLLAISPLLVLPLLIAESVATGSFEWSFEREFARTNDYLYIYPGALGGVAALYFYFFGQLRRGWQTIGEYVLGFKIVSIGSGDEPPRFGVRTVLAFIGLCGWPVSVFLALIRDDKQFWWDTQTDTRAVMVNDQVNSRI